MSIYKRGKVWWMDVFVGTERRRVRKSTGTSDEVQARIVEQSMQAINRGITTRQRANAIMDAILPVERQGVKIVDMDCYWAQAMKNDNAVISKLEWQKRRSILTTLGAWLKDNTRVTVVEEVTPEIASQFAAYYQRFNGCKVATRNKVVGMLGTCWKMFIKNGKANESPWKYALAQRNPDEEESGRAFTDAEVTRLLDAAREIGCEWYGVSIVALYTGLREGDVVNLEQDEIDWNARVIDLKPNKTKRRKIRVRVPMHPKVREVLKSAQPQGQGAAGCKWIFPWRHSHPNHGDERDGDKHFSRVLEQAGIVAKKGEKITFHCWRHTFVSRLAEAGVAQDIRMKLAGHTNVDTHAIYDHAEAGAEAAIASLK